MTDDERERRSWVVVLRDVEAAPEDLPAAVERARDALGLPHSGSITAEQWIFDEATGRKLKDAA